MKALQDNDLVYKDYHITSCSWVKFVFSHKDYDGPEDSRIGTGDSIQDCIEQIQERLEEEWAKTEAGIKWYEAVEQKDKEWISKQVRGGRNKYDNLPTSYLVSVHEIINL